MPKVNMGKIIPNLDYRVDDRVTFKKGSTERSVNVADGPTKTMVSGVRLNSSSGYFVYA